LVRSDVEIEQVALRAVQRLIVAESKAKLIKRVAVSVVALVRMRSEVRIAPDHPAEIAPLVVRILVYLPRKLSRSDQFVVLRQVWPLLLSAHRAGNELPAA